MFNNIRNNTAEQRRPRPQQQRIPIVHRRVPAQQQNRAPGYTPRRPSSPTTSKAEALKLSRGRTVSRQHQRPWTLKEWAFVERIPKDIDMEAMKELMLKFQDKFKWMPTEGQLRSQYWYFKKSSRRMKEFLTTYNRITKRDGGGKGTDMQIVLRLKTGSLRPSW